MPKGVVVRRTANNADQGRNLIGRQFVEGFVEIVLGTQTEAVNGPRPVLTEKNFVDVGRENIFLGEPQF